MKPMIGIGYDMGCCNQENYIYSIEKAGGIPVLIPVMERLESMTRLLDQLDGLLLAGGTDINPLLYGENQKFGLGKVNPMRDEWELKLLKYFIEKKNSPVFGICRGHQLINIYFGGTLYQNLEKEQPKGQLHWLSNYPSGYPSQEIYIQGKSKLYDVYQKDKIYVNSLHNQGIKQLGEGLIATARGKDQLVEAVEHESKPWVLGVQYHPELMTKAYKEQLRLFEAFIQACAAVSA